MNSRRREKCSVPDGPAPRTRPWPAGGALLALVLTGVFPAGARAQNLRLDLVPSPGDVLLCDRPGEVRLAIQLDNPGALAVGGYQLFLRFPAERIQLIGFEPQAVDGTLSVNGPPPIGAGFGGCAFSETDAWDDGRGLDVVSVVASAFGDGQAAPLTETSATLGELVFEIPGDALPGSVELGIVVEGCVPFLTQTVAFFDDGGELLPLELGASTVEFGIAAEPKVENLSCTDDPDGVRLSWTGPPGVQVDGYVVYRRGEVLFALVPGFASSVLDESARDCGDVEYEVVVRSAGADASCGVRCTVEGGGVNVPFRRGDVNQDERVNVGDPIASLRFQFRGVPIQCVDAADYDDNGRIEITDAIQTLSYVFLDGDPPPEPFTTPGQDPTADDLCCLAAP